MRELFFKALHKALWDIPFDEEIKEDVFCHIMKTAREQTVEGLVFEALSHTKTKINRNITFEYLGEQIAIMQQNSLVNKCLIEFSRDLGERGIDFLVVKGQTLASLYPQPALRMAGDIDYLIKDDYSFVRDRIGVPLPHTLEKKEIAYVNNGVTFELHTDLLDFGSRRNQQIWGNVMKNAWNTMHYAEVGGWKIRTLPPTINAIYLFLHLFFHFVSEGVSLRQLCDWAIFLHHNHKEIDFETVESTLQELKMLDAYKAFGVILIDDIGLPKNDFPFELGSAERRWKNKILTDIFKGGNFGKLNHQSESGLKHRFETLRMLVVNTFRYRRLAPREMNRMLLKVIKIDCNVLMKRVRLFNWILVGVLP